MSNLPPPLALGTGLIDSQTLAAPSTVLSTGRDMLASGDLQAIVAREPTP